MRRRFHSSRLRELRPTVQGLEGRRLLVSITNISQTGDFVSQDGSIGGDGLLDVTINLENIQTLKRVDSVVVQAENAGTVYTWKYGANPEGYPTAAFLRDPLTAPGAAWPYEPNYQRPTGTVSISPRIGITQLNNFVVTLTYDGVTAADISQKSTTPITINPNAAAPVLTAATVPTYVPNLATFQANQFTTDNTFAGQKAGDFRITLDALPSGYTSSQIKHVLLSDGTGSPSDWRTTVQDGRFGGAIWSYSADQADPTSRFGTLRMSRNPNATGSVAEFAVPPIRNEDGANMTMTLVMVNSNNVEQTFYTQFTGKPVNINLVGSPADDRASSLQYVLTPVPSDPNSVTYVTSLNSNPTQTTITALLANPAVKRIRLTSGTYNIPMAPALYISNSDPVNKPQIEATLKIDRPLTISGDLDAAGQPLATLLFTGNSATTASEWTIKYGAPIFINSSHVLLTGFKVRFNNSIAFNSLDKKADEPKDDSYAVVVASPGSGRPGDGNIYEKLVDVALSNLNIEGPAPAWSDSGDSGGAATLRPQGIYSWNLLSIRGASGIISNNTLRGGTSFITNGPWDIRDNTYLGTVPSIYTFPSSYPRVALRNTPIPSWTEQAFKLGSPLDTTLQNNHLRVTPRGYDSTIVDGNSPTASSAGTVYRFLLIKAGAGPVPYNLKVINNTVEGGLGTRFTDDTSAAQFPESTPAGYFNNDRNAPEMILNETYDIGYEGITYPISADRKLVTIPSGINAIRGRPVKAGDTIAILSGTYVGQYRRIAQVIDEPNLTTLILDQPMPGTTVGDRFAVSVSHGMYKTLFQLNTINLTKTTSVGMALNGAMFDTTVIDNTFFGDQTFAYNGNKAQLTNTAIRAWSYYNQPSNNNASYIYQNPWPKELYLTQAPLFEFKVDHNTVSGSPLGIWVGTQHNQLATASFGRTYVTASITNNKFTGYAAPTIGGPANYPIDTTSLLNIGDVNYGRNKVDPMVQEITRGYAKLKPNGDLDDPAPTLYRKPAADTTSTTLNNNFRFADPRETRVTLSGNWLERAAGSTYTKNIVVNAAIVNGVPTVYSGTGGIQPLPTAIVTVSSLGQTGVDIVKPLRWSTTAANTDGFQDLKLKLDNLPANDYIDQIRLRDGDTSRLYLFQESNRPTYGLNPNDLNNWALAMSRPGNSAGTGNIDTFAYLYLQYTYATAPRDLTIDIYLKNGGLTTVYLPASYLANYNQGLRMPTETAPSAVQDGSDKVGQAPWSTTARNPDDRPDMVLSLANLLPISIDQILITDTNTSRRYLFQEPGRPAYDVDPSSLSNWAIAFGRANNATPAATQLTTATLYFQYDRPASAGSFTVTIRYNDQTSSIINVTPGASFDPYVRFRTEDVLLSRRQDNTDIVGPWAWGSQTPNNDGKADLRIQLGNLPNYSIDQIVVSDSPSNGKSYVFTESGRTGSYMLAASANNWGLALGRANNSQLPGPGQTISYSTTADLYLQYSRPDLTTSNLVITVYYRMGSTYSYSTIPLSIRVDGTTTAVARGIDSSTSGTWKGVFGSDGYSIAGDTSSLPSYATMSLVSSYSLLSWANPTTSTAGLQKGGSSTDRIAAAWSNTTSFDIDLNLKDSLVHRVALYALDWDLKSRIENVQILDYASQAVLVASANTGTFQNGKYFLFDLSGHVTIRVTKVAGDNAVIGGLFFDTSSGLAGSSLGIYERTLGAGGVVTARGDNAANNEGKDKAFDNSITTKWLDFSASSWIQYQFPGSTAYIINQYSMTSGNDTNIYPDRAPKSWVLKGSNDGVNWTTLDTRTNAADTGAYSTRTYNFTNTTAYSYYKFDSILASAGSIIQLSEIRLFGPATSTGGAAGLLSLDPGPTSSVVSYDAAMSLETIDVTAPSPGQSGSSGPDRLSSRRGTVDLPFAGDTGVPLAGPSILIKPTRVTQFGGAVTPRADWYERGGKSIWFNRTLRKPGGRFSTSPMSGLSVVADFSNKLDDSGR